MLNRIAAGEPSLSRRLAAKILDEFARVCREGTAKELADELAARELEVLQLVARG